MIKTKLNDCLRETEVKLRESHENQSKQEDAQTVNNIKENTKIFYKYGNEKLKTRSSMGPLVTHNGKLISSAIEMAQLLCKHNESIFTLPRQEKMVPYPDEFFEINSNTRPYR